ncbi:hypothetical protein TNCV_2831961 [Trichonephila clavipes]|nr:hypothetical protein TNCV_2831961 [Trichonephila clavipes]
MSSPSGQPYSFHHDSCKAVHKLLGVRGSGGLLRTARRKSSKKYLTMLKSEEFNGQEGVRNSEESSSSHLVAYVDLWRWANSPVGIVPVCRNARRT